MNQPLPSQSEINIIITDFLTHGSKKDIEVITFITSAGDF